MSSVGVGLIGAGPWGTNLARVLARARGAELRGIADLAPDRRQRAGAAHPGVRLTAADDDLLADERVRAVVVAVDSPRHHAVAKRALEAGRHVLVEKPMALSAADAAELVALARRRDVCLMVGHVLLYHPAIERARALVAAGELGDVLYLDATRVAFGKVRPGESVWWSVGPHDVSLALHLFDAVPATVSATGAAWLQVGRPDVVFATLRFPDGRMAHVHVSWVAPAKPRALSVVGTRKTLTFHEGSIERPLVIHHRGLSVAAAAAAATAAAAAAAQADAAAAVEPPGSRVETPAVAVIEPLLAECEHFVTCVATGVRPRSDGRHALDVIRVLEAGDRSLRAGGAPVEVAAGEPT